MIKFTGVPLKGILLVTIWLLSFSSQVAAEPGRWEKDLSGPCWRLWLDREADWKNDDIYLPPVNISTLPVNPPTYGWKRQSKRNSGRLPRCFLVEHYVCTGTRTQGKTDNTRV